MRFDGLEDGGAAVFQLVVVAQALLDGLDVFVAQSAGGLFAVTADEGNGGAVVE